MQLTLVVRKAGDVVCRKIGEDYVLIPVRNKINENDMLYSLNATGAFIWNLIDGKRDIKTIVHLLSDITTEDESVIGNDVLSHIKDLMMEKLVIKI